MRVGGKAAARAWVGGGGLLALFVLAATLARGDGGAVVVQERRGDLVVSVFAAPVPLRAGPADVSVLLQRADDDSAVLEAEVAVRLVREAGRARAGGDWVRADHAQATNRILYAARLETSGPGRWILQARIGLPPIRVEVEAPVEVQPPLPPAARFWVWIVLAPLVVVLFLLHQWLRDR